MTSQENITDKNFQKTFIEEFSEFGIADLCKSILKNENQRKSKKIKKLLQGRSKNLVFDAKLIEVNESIEVIL